MNNPEGERADLSKVEIEITLASAFNNGIREGHTVIIFTQPDASTNRYEGKSFERKDESSLHLITNKILACYQREANKEIARLLNIPQELNNSQDLNNSQVSCKDSVDSTITDLLEKPLNNALLAIRKEHLLLMPYVCNESISYLLGEKGILK
ncbi:TPA: DNA-binding protein, partial [Escherichia coli]|nr:DNA-binding protein [Escherichia coli]